MAAFWVLSQESSPKSYPWCKLCPISDRGAFVQLDRKSECASTLLASSHSVMSLPTEPIRFPVVGNDVQGVGGNKILPEPLWNEPVVRGELEWGGSTCTPQPRARRDEKICNVGLPR
jgi:hypothetical protein